MGKAKRAQKRARREARGKDEEQRYIEAEQMAQRRLRRRRILVATIPALAIVVAAVFHYGLSNGRAAGIALLLGAVLFFLLGLSLLGSSVRPRDRDRAGSIDFGRRR